MLYWTFVACNTNMGIVGAKNIFVESKSMFFFTGLVGLRPPRIFRKTFPGYIYVAILLFVYYALYLLTIGHTLELYEMMKEYSIITETREVQHFLNPIFITIMIVSSVSKSLKIRGIFTEIGAIDGKLKLLNIRLDYTKFTRTDFSKICGIIVITILFNLLEYFPQVGPDTKRFFVLIWIVNTFPQFVNSLAIASFVIVITKIRRRLEAINEFIPNMIIFEKSIISTLETEANNVFRLRLLNRIHEKLINATIELSEAHGLVLLSSFVVYFLACCSHLKNIPLCFGRMFQLVDFVVETLWVIFYLGKYVYVIEACDSVTLQGKLSGRLLHEKWTDIDHHPLMQEMDMLATQIESRNLRLTACNFFVIDYPALKTIIIALTAYLFFVSQLTGSCNK